MTATPASGAEREFCPAVNGRTGWRCDFAEHPYNTHVSWVDGEMRVWSSPTHDWRNTNLSGGDRLRDAPDAFRQLALNQLVKLARKPGVSLWIPRRKEDDA